MAAGAAKVVVSWTSGMWSPSIMFSQNAPLIARFSLLLAVGLSLNVKLVRQDGVQTVFCVGNGSRTLNLVHLDSFQSETLDEVKQCHGEHNERH